MTAYWRVRLKNGYGDFTQQAWERDEVGIWYGAWTAEDFGRLNDPHLSNQELADELDQLPGQKALVSSGTWDRSIPGKFVETARRFFNRISEGDWAVIYLETNKLIGLAQMSGLVSSDSTHPLNTRCGEQFKFRKLSQKKTFALSELPDAYRLVPTQGRGNVHKFDRMNPHVELLAKHSTAHELVQVLGNLPFDQKLDLMSASAWESFCVSWLIMEKNFLPTGLSTGRTLQTIDIVGRNRMTGNRIIAQCKKDPYPVSIDEKFLSALAPGDEGYYFAFGGCLETATKHDIHVIDGDYARKWAETENGSTFKRLFLGR